jgi:aminoglycoside phosphotransferase (APT) family kinase protein
MTMLDRTAPIRSGEELDLQRLATYLGVDSETVSAEQFPRGFSNLTYLVRAGEQEFVLRRPPFGVPKGSAHDMTREYRILSALRPVYAKVPRAIQYCDDESVIGAPFYLMERVRGVILRNTASPDATPAAMRALSESFVDALVELHGVDVERAGLSSLGNPVGYIGRLVSGWTKRWTASRTSELPEMDRVAAWLDANQPTERGASLVHNDFKYDNLVLDPTDLSRIVAVLDWEMSTLGDPLMDLGTSLGYWIEANDSHELQSIGIGVTALPGNLSREAVVDRYVRASGRDVSRIVFYYAFGVFKIAVIVQQIYARFVRGVTHDARFATLDRSVAALARTAWAAVTAGRIADFGGAT